MACGEEISVSERYWTICWKKVWFVKIPYPCRKIRLVTKYCYDFSIVEEKCYVFRARLKGCCDGLEFHWSAACFGWFTAYFTNKQICRNRRLEPKGECSLSGPIPGGPIHNNMILNN